MLDRSRGPVIGHFVLRWALATTVGVSVGLPLGLALSAPVGAIVGMVLVTPAILSLGASVLGISQWLVLRDCLHQSAWWIAVTALGFGGGLTVGVVAVEVVGAAVTGAPVRMSSTGTLGLTSSFAVIGICGGLGVGLAQWLWLQRRGYPHSRWILVNVAGFGIAFVVAFLITLGALGDFRSLPSVATFLLVSGFIGGSITSVAARQLQAVTLQVQVE